MDELLDRDQLSDPEQDYLDVLSDQVEAYEAGAVPIRPVGDADLLRFLIETRGTTQAAVAKEAGIAESTISEVLAGKRRLNRAQIGKLARHFHVGAGGVRVRGVAVPAEVNFGSLKSPGLAYSPSHSREANESGEFSNSLLRSVR